MSYAPAPPSSLLDLDLKCPPLPQTLLEAVDLMGRSEPPVDTVVAMVQRDPAAVARLLRVVNSSFYGRRGHITDVHHAVVVLGASVVVGMMMSMGMKSMRTVLDDRTTLPFLNLVRHSVATAFLARYVVAHRPEAVEAPKVDGTAGTAFTAGLMHDFGKLVLLYNAPEAATRLYANATLPEDWLVAEREAVGHDHVEVGLFLAQRLNFPEALTDAITQHHAPDAEAVGWPARVIRTASRTAHAWGYGWSQAVDTSRVEAAVPMPGSEPEALAACMADARDELEAYVDAFG